MQTLTTLPTEQLQETAVKVYLTAEFKLILHTEIAKSLFEGTLRKGKSGLVQFASMMKLLWQASQADDPYADLYLIKTYEAIEEARESLRTYEAILQQQLNSLRGFEVDLFKHPDPLKQPLRFATPFAYMGAMLLEQVDYVNRLLFTLKRIGLVAKNNIMPITLIKEIAKVFRLPQQWHHTGVTREDIYQNNEKAQEAQALLKELPVEILNKEITFSFLPRVRHQHVKV